MYKQALNTIIKSVSHNYFGSFYNQRPVLLLPTARLPNCATALAESAGSSLI